MGVEKSPGEHHSTKMAERRKSSKPIMEKRRRERINNSLNELKNLLLESRKKDSSCCSKLEKADILEMTVQHLKSMKAQQEKASSSNDPIALAHYRAGFNQSAAEISRYLINAQDIEVQVRTRLLTHLSNSCYAVLSSQAPVKQYYSPPSSTLFATPPVPKSPEVTPSILSDPSLTFNVPDPGPYFFHPSHLQLMPATLNNGNFAAVLVPSPNIYSAVHHPPVSTQHPQLVPVPTLSLSDNGQIDSEKNSRNSSSHSTTSSDTSTVWRPWCETQSTSPTSPDDRPTRSEI